jgi:hypothetical protein
MNDILEALIATINESAQFEGFIRKCRIPENHTYIIDVRLKGQMAYAMGITRTIAEISTDQDSITISDKLSYQLTRIKYGDYTEAVLMQALNKIKLMR